jgi:hypothetical protein
MIIDNPCRSQEMDDMQHIEADETHAVERYLLGEMPARERDDFEEHFFECTECAAAVKSTAIFADNARAVFQEQQQQVQPAKQRGGAAVPWWKRFSLPVLAPVFAVLALFCVTGYQNFVLIPSLRSQLARVTAPQPLSSFALHGTSRGEQPLIRLPNSGFFSLYFDVPGTSPAGYLCEIRDASGSRRFALTVSPPKPGAAVNLLLDRSSFPAGEYNLVVRSEPPDTMEVGQYPFKIEAE